MKKFFSIFILMSVVILVPVVASSYPQATHDTTEYVAQPAVSFEIKAYKKTPSPVILAVYDAFSEKLDEVVKDSKINVYSKLGYFLTTDMTRIDDPSRQVIFSFVVYGGAPGKFNLSAELTAFKSVESTLVDNEMCYTMIPTRYEVVSTQCGFQNSSSETSNGFRISMDNPSGDVNIANDKNIAKLSRSCTVEHELDKTQIIIGDIWYFEGAVAMAIQKKSSGAAKNAANDEASDIILRGYDDAGTRSGEYQASVKITLSPSV